jgi:hypothetical protein
VTEFFSFALHLNYLFRHLSGDDGRTAESAFAERVPEKERTF